MLLSAVVAGGSKSTNNSNILDTLKNFGALKQKCPAQSQSSHKALRFPVRRNQYCQLSRFSWQRLHALWGSEKIHLKLVLRFKRPSHCQVRQTGLRLDSTGNTLTQTDAFRSHNKSVTCHVQSVRDLKKKKSHIPSTKA